MSKELVKSAVGALEIFKLGGSQMSKKLLLL